MKQRFFSFRSQKPSKHTPALTTNSRIVSRMMATAAITLAVAACSSNDDQDANDNSTTIDPAVSGPAPTMPAPGSNPEDVIGLDGLDGSWRKDCLAADSSEAPYTTALLSVSFDSANLTITNYADSACTETLSVSDSELSLIFSGEMSTTSLGEAHQVEITNEQTNDVRFDLMLILNDSLYLGDQTSGLDGATEQSRPTQLDQVSFYIRDVEGS